MKRKFYPTESYLYHCIEKLTLLSGNPDLPDLPGIDKTLLINVSYYIKQRFDSQIDESEICSLLAEALQRLQNRLKKQGEAVESPSRYFREIVKHLVKDKINQERHTEKFLISPEGVATMGENGVPDSILLKFEALVSSRPMSYRTFLDKLAQVLDGNKFSRGEQNLYRRMAMSAFRFKMQSDGYSPLTESLPDPDSHAHKTIIDDAYYDCLKQLKRSDRDLIKLRFGLDPGLDGFQFSFEEIQEIFGFDSLQQVRNRYHYALKILRDCLNAKGYSVG